MAKYQNPRYLFKFCTSLLRVLHKRRSLLQKVTKTDNGDFDFWPRYSAQEF